MSICITLTYDINILRNAYPTTHIHVACAVIKGREDMTYKMTLLVISDYTSQFCVKIIVSQLILGGLFKSV